MSHTLIIMHWQIDLSSSQDKRGFLAKAVIDVLLCPAKGPDINSIEIIWSYISRRINEMNLLPRNTDWLRAAVHNE